MRRVIFILLFLTVTDLQVVAQRVDTLYSGLKNAQSFIVLNNAIYIVESGNHRVLKLDLEGNLIEKYGNRGGGNYQFDNPSYITSSVGLKIFVSDPGNNRIQVFDKRWQYLSSIKGNEKFQSRDEIAPSYIGVNNLRQIIFYDTKTKTLVKYDEDGTYRDDIPIPSSVKSVSGIQTSGDKIFVLDSKSGMVHRLSENGFYETFYPAKDANDFHYVDGIMLLFQSKKMDMSQINPSDQKDVLLENPSQKLFKNKDFVYLLTTNDLFRIELK